MKKVIVFGTGESAKKVLKAIRNENAEIIAFADNDFNKHGQIMNGVEIINPKTIIDREFDVILISILKYKSVEKQLSEYGIEADKMLSYFDPDACEKDTFTELINGYIQLRDIYDDKLFKMSVKFENIPYEVANSSHLFFPEVKNITETIEYLVKNKCSISRYGDGEFKLMFGENLGFQDYDERLADRLKEVLNVQKDNHIVGILNVYGSLDEYEDYLQEYFRKYLVRTRKFQYELLNHNKTYYDAFITRPYISYKDRSGAAKWFEQMKQIWNEKDLLIVEGEKSRLGVGNDLFANANSIKRIICPSVNAFEKYDEILASVKAQSKDYLVMIALGPTATVLAYDLAEVGYQAIDIGHIDVEYEWFKMGATEKVPLKNKFTNEAFGGNGELSFTDGKYEEEIIKYIV